MVPFYIEGEVSTVEINDKFIYDHDVLKAVLNGMTVDTSRSYNMAKGESLILDVDGHPKEN